LSSGVLSVEPAQQHRAIRAAETERVGHHRIKPGIVHSQTYTAYQASITNEVRHFIDVCVKGGGAPLSTLDDALHAQHLIEAIETSIAEGRTVDL